MRKLLFTLLAAFFVWAADAQNRTITGKVTDAGGKPVPNASVVIKGTGNGTATDDKGQFSLSVPEKTKTLVITAVGYSPSAVVITGKTNVEVSLELLDKSLDEVVVVGYGTQRKVNVTAAVSKVDASKIENKPMAAIDQMLQGAVPGLQATSSTGQPGAVTPVRIRGVGSFSYAGASPLYVVDGVQVNSGDISNGNGGGFNINPSTNVLATINADDIENITVLKDAAAISIYGSRGANGVIVITTKSGRAGKTQFRFDMEAGTNNVIMPPKSGMPLRSADWFTLLNEGLVNQGASQATINTTMTAYGYGNGVDVDWLGLITRPGSQKQYNLNASGGDNKTKFFISAGYFKQEGTTIGSDLKRFTGNVRIKHSVNDKLSFDTKISAGQVNQNSVLASNGPSGGGGYFGNPAYVSLVLRPTQNPYNADGSFNISTNNFGFPAHYNPLFVAANDKRYLKAVNGVVNEIIEYKILKNLKYTGTLGLQYNDNEEYQYNNPFHGDASSNFGEGISIITRTFLWDLINQLDYHYDIIKSKKFYVDAKAGYEAIKNNFFQQIGDVQSFPPRSDLFLSTVGATSTNGKASGSDYTFGGLFANANISFQNRYALYGSFRRDGSSRFGSNNIYGNFYSAGVSWNASNEAFFTDAKIDKVVSNLKLRASYGTSGNAEIGNYTWRPTYGYGANYNGTSGGTFNNIGNVGLQWEHNNQLDLGVDISFWKNRINLTADKYTRKTDGSLFNQPVSRTTGFSSFINNVANLENKGVEISLNVIPVKTKDLTWELNFNYSHNTNKVTQLPNSNSDVPNGSYLLRVGEDFYSFYSRGWAGVDPANGNPLWYTDSTRSATTTNYNAAKLFLVGKSATPKYFGTLGTKIDFKGFSFSADFYYNYGNYYQEAYYRFFMDGTFPTRGKYAFMLNRWQKPGDVTDVPKYVYNNASFANSATGSDRTLFKGDYIRLRNIQLGYRIASKMLLNKLHITGAYFYVRGTNVWTFTPAKNLLSDPEQGILGVNNQQVLPQRSVTGGVNINF